MRNRIKFLPVIFYSGLTLLLLTSISTKAYATEDITHLMSDMGTSETNQDKRPSWNAVDSKLKLLITNEYRNPSYDEKQFFDKYVELVPADAIIDFLEAEEATCHRQAHELGRAIFRKTNDISEALSICGNGCTNACMHGAIGEAFSDAPGQQKGNANKKIHKNSQHQHQPTSSIDKLVEKMEPFCHGGEMARQHKRGNCAHAMGHALMLKTDHNIGLSINGCSQFNEPGMDYYCATGVYMQYMDNVTANGSRKTDTKRWGSNYPCNKFTAYPAACYRYIVSEVKQERGLGLEHLVVLCSQLPAETRAGCFHGLGATYTPLVKEYPDLLKVVCSFGGSKEQTLCIEGVIEKLADFNEQWALKACDTLGSETRDICIAAARGKMYRLDKATMDFYRTGIEKKHNHH